MQASGIKQLVVLNATLLSAIVISTTEKNGAYGEDVQRQVTLPPQPSLVDARGFLDMSAEAAEYRKTRLVPADRFLELMKKEDTLVLDTRSKDAFTRRHLKGAVHLNFSDITDEKLAKVIPSKTTRVLIYCNNNFAGDAANFPTKRIVLALNVPTFINLYASGYRNVYELSELVSVDDSRFTFEGTAVEPATNSES